jgi:hypothetical protein
VAASTRKGRGGFGVVETAGGGGSIRRQNTESSGRGNDLAAGGEVVSADMLYNRPRVVPIEDSSAKERGKEASSMADKPVDPAPSEDQIDAQAREQTGQQQVRLRINEADVKTSYTNAFRTNCSAEEVIIDFGMNMVVPNPAANKPGAGDQPAGEITFHVNDRVIMNYFTAKRLAVLLGNIVRQYEKGFGELKLNAAERAVKQ